MKKARKKFEIKDVKNAGSRTKSSGLFHRYFYVTVLILFIGFTILGSSLLIFIARYQSEEKTALLKQNAQTVSQTAAALIQKGYSLEESNKNSTLLMSVSTAQLSQAIDADIYICDTDGKIICCKDIWQSNLVMYMGECIVHSKYTVPETALSKLSSGGYTETGTLGGMYKSSHFISVEPIVASGKLCGAVIASQDTDSLHEPVRAMLKMFLFSAILALAIAFVATYVMTYQMTKPLREMSAAAKQYAKGDYLRIVSDEVKRLSRLVTGMLNMSKIEAGQLKIQPKEFDISAMTFKTMLGFERAIDEKKIEIRGLDKVEPLNICADEDMINQVVYNLIDNAVKFTNEGGYIEVAIKSDSEKMIFSVKNSGKGISREEAGKVFERFYKTDKSRSYDVKGAGLGLYIVKTIIDMHGGQITVNSEPGEYTQFVFWLPLR